MIYDTLKTFEGFFPAEEIAISIFFCHCFPLHSTRKNVGLSGHQLQIGAAFVSVFSGARADSELGMMGA